MSEIIDKEIALTADYWISKLAKASGGAFYDLIAGTYVESGERQILSFEMPEPLSDQLLRLSREKDVNVYKLLLACLTVLMGKYSGHSNLLLTTSTLALEEGGMTAEGVNTEPALVFFTLPFREEMTVKELLAVIHQDLINNLRHQQYPYSDLVKEWTVKPHLAQAAFQVGICYEPLNRPHADLESTEILFRISRQERRFRVSLEYNPRVYTPETVALLHQHWLTATRLVSEDLTRSMRDLIFVTEYDRERIFGAFNQTALPFFDGPVIRQFEQQAEVTPDALAVKSGEVCLTYRELNERGNQIAHYLLQVCHLQKQEKVALLVNRSERIITGIIGILKAGGLYIPIDLSSPKERVQFFLEDSESRIVLTEGSLLAEAPQNGTSLFIAMDQIPATDHVQNPNVSVHPQDLAYMIYTSGTTGKPKGAMIYHRSLANHVNWFRRQFDLTEKDSTMLINSYSFDGCYSYIWATLTVGAALHVPTDSFFNPDQTLRYIAQEGITFLKMVPSTFGVLVHSSLFNEVPDICQSVRVIKQGGETINVKNLQKYLERYPHAILGNHYGATESTIGSVAHWVNKDTIHAFARNPVIGSPFDNQTVFILDEQNRLQPIGVPGEICIGGVGVGKGYFKREALTARKFIDHPFVSGEKLYRTGDQGRWLPNGTLAFSGRIDNQVKIRGYRVELDEISQTLKCHGAIRDSLVLVFNQDGQDQLVAYLIAEAGPTPDPAALQAFLKSQLPEYMIPLYFVVIDRIPLTPNGKIDKCALPDPEQYRLQSRKAKTGPTNALEEQLLQLWAQLLDTEEIGIDDNFFDIGGHSLKATQLISRIHKQFNVRLPLREVFFHPTIATLAPLLEEGKSPASEAFTDIQPVAEQPHYELSHAQKRMWILDQLQQDQIAYNIPHAMRLQGKLDRDAFEKALIALVDRHEILRTFFPTVDGEPRQQILSSEALGFVLLYDDLQNKPDNEQLAAEIASLESNTVFDLAQGPLVRTRLVQLGGSSYVFFFTLHHIISDGWSTRIFTRDILQLYEAFCQGLSNPLEPLPIHYKDFTVWQNALLASAKAQVHRNFWNGKFAGELPVLDLPADYSRPKISSYEGGYRTRLLSPSVGDRLAQYATEHQASLFMVLLSAVNTLLYRYSGQRDLIVGSPIAGREHEGLANQIGFYVNTLAIRSQLEGDKSFAQLVEATKSTLLDAYQHQIYPFDQLVEDLNLERDTARSPLFDVMVVMQNNDSAAESTPSENGLSVAPCAYEFPVSKFDLSIDFSEEKEGLVIGFEYSTRLFSAIRIERMMDHLVNLLTLVAENPSAVLDEMDYLTEAEKSELSALAGKVNPLEQHLTVHGTFEEQVQRQPDALALSDALRTYTYAQLNGKANRLAAYLQQRREVKAGDIVAIVMSRSADFIISMLATLKAGAAYLPVELPMTSARIGQLLDQTRVTAVITDQPQLFQTLEKSREDNDQKALLAVIDIQEFALEETPVHAFLPAGNAASLAYVMFTSGSTGRPKGVMIEHRGILNLISDSYVGLHARDRMLQTGSLSFDAATFEIWGTLLNGGQIHVRTLDNLLEKDQLKKLLREKEITRMFFTTSWFNQLADQDLSLFDSLEHVLVGGEKLSPAHIRKVKEHQPSLRITNLYGPTEITTFSICTDVPTQVDSLIPLGRPIANSVVRIVDARLRPVPKGIPGEILLGGEGLSRGYLYEEEKTRQQFIDGLFAPGERLYRSGDLGRWLEDGQVEFLGRLDDQVKIRGYRVEPGEIANLLMAYPTVKEAVVMVYPSKQGEKLLAGYYTASEPVSRTDVKAYLEGLLPSYMVPVSLLQVSSIPLNANGKTDLRALPQPVIVVDSYLPPANQTEEALVNIWSEVLGMDANAISTEAHFFDLGGHSLKAMVLASLIYKSMQVTLSLADIFRMPTVRGMAQVVLQTAQGVYEPISVAEPQPYYPLSAAQRRLFVMQQFEADQVAYNIPGVFTLSQYYSADVVEKAFIQLISRHESLRTSFEMLEGEPVQRIHETVRFDMERINGCDSEALLKAFIRPFDLSQAPLLRVGYLSGASLVAGTTVLLDCHHIITDGWSQTLLQEELLALLAQEPLPAVRFQYKDFACWQHLPEQQHTYQTQQAYWLKVFAAEGPVLELPTDFPRPEVQSFEGAEAHFLLSPEDTDFLKNLCHRHQVTLYMALLSVWTLLLSKLGQQEDITVGTSVAGRRHPDLERIVGMFVNTVPMRHAPKGLKHFSEYLQEVKTQTLAAFEHQEYPFQDLVAQVWQGRDASRNPLFDTLFSLLDGADAPTDVDLQASNIHFQTEGTTAKFDLKLIGVDLGNQLYFSLSYCTRLFRQDTIGRFVQFFRQIISALHASALAEHDPLLYEIDLLTPEEKHRLLVMNNPDGTLLPPPSLTYSTLFEAQAARFPDRMALADETRSMSYRELNAEANRLARLLREKGVQADTLVGILLPPAHQTILAILAVFKAGGAYLPMDTEMPGERIAHILQDSGVKWVITETDFASLLAPQITALCLQTLSLEAYPDDNLMPVSTPDSLAYVIYTSGSTGKPKGVPIEQKGLVNYVGWFAKAVSLTESDATVLTCSYSFDLGHTLTFPILTRGGALHVVQKDTYLSATQLGEYVQRHRITYLKLTPTLFSVFFRGEAFRREWLAGLRFLMFGGEAIHAADVDQFLQTYPDKYVINHYGPTETTIGAVTKRITVENKEEFVACPVIGKPIDQMRAYVLDRYLNPLPAGVKGQLYLSGVGTSPGYLHQPELSSEKFFDNPFVAGERLYATGDLAMWTPKGDLVFYGRTDHQIKIRGYRVELGEIEQLMLAFPGVKEACVMVRKDQADDWLLAAFLTVREPIDLTQLRQALNEQLPNYMVPAHLILLEAFPMTPNGKVDRHVLAAHSLENNTPVDRYVAPANATEEALQMIWQQVLDQCPISVEANFFEISGHSLKALKIIARIARELSFKVQLSEFFRQPTIRNLAETIARKELNPYENLVPAPELAHYPLSHAQKRLWMLDQLEEGQVSYNTPKVFQLQGVIDAGLLQRCLEATLMRHQILRTVFRVVDGEPRQFIRTGEQLADCFFLHDLRAGSEAIPLASAFVTEKINQPFYLAQGPLLKLYLVRVDADLSILLLNLHHIISDGWSFNVLITELFDRYNAGTRGEMPDLAPLALQYKDYAWWQHDGVLNGKMEVHRQYWRQVLEGERPRLTLPEDHPRPAVKTSNGAGFTVSIGAGITQELEGLALERQASLFMILLAAWKTLFYRYTGLTDILIGTPVSGREKAELADQLGFYVNTLPVRTRFSGQESFVQLLDQVKANMLAAVEHQSYPFDLMISDLGEAADPSHSPLFDLMFVFQNNDELNEQSLSLDGLLVEELGDELRGSKLDISFVGRKEGDTLQFYVEYNTDIYEEASLRCIMAHYEQLLSGILMHSGAPLKDLAYLGAEKETVLSDFNRTARLKETLPSVQAYFEKQVERDPNQLAVIHPAGTMSYGELNQKANQWAAWIRSQCAEPRDQLIAFVLERSEWQIVAMLGILKAGAAFLPIDPSYPEARIRFILTDAQPVLILTEGALLDWLSTEEGGLSNRVVRREALAAALSTCSDANPISLTRPIDLAYVIYTSGSTGQPKGVLIEHGGNINMVTDQVRRFGVTSQDRCLQFASISFDASVYEIFIALYAGSTLVLLTPGLINHPQRFTDYLQQHHVTVVTLPPVYLVTLDRSRLHFLRVVITAGEAPHRNDALELAKHVRYYNAYGPTEYSVCATVYQVRGDEKSIPIGQPLDNTRAYVLDEHLQPRPVGFWGELHLAGQGIARGYLNRAELTRQKFITNPFEPGEKLYKTGDLARWLPDGNLEFSGRSDHMVKIRGYRVELGEIEHALLQHPLVSQAVVTYQPGEGGKDFLCAYLITGGQEVDPTEMKRFLSSSLPAYMVPTHWVPLDQLPVTASGKVNYKALPPPTMTGHLSPDCVLPANPLEAQLVEMWQEILNRSVVSTDDHFFEIGGHSILAIQLISAIWRTFGKNVSIRDLLQYPTVQSLAVLLQQDETMEPHQGLLLALNHIREGQPMVFMVPPVLGSSTVFRPLAQELALQRLNCYGLQYRGFDQEEPFDDSIAAMAQSFRLEISAVATDKKAPIFLLGYSMGALLALETAALLEGEGYQVPLILLDKDSDTQYGDFHLDEAVEPEADLLAVLMQRHLGEEGPTLPTPDTQRIRRLLAHNIQLLQLYQPGKTVASDILALEAGWSGRQNKMAGWQSFTSGKLIRSVIMADHFSLLGADSRPELMKQIRTFVRTYGALFSDT